MGPVCLPIKLTCPHRDVKPENILVSSTGPLADDVAFRLADMGLARCLPDDDATATTPVGTRKYRAR